MALRTARKRGTQALNVPMSSMIDVVFLLLIYFIVTQKEEVPEAHLAVNLPSPNQTQQQPQTKPNLLEIEVHPGQVYIQGAPRSFEIVERTIRSLAKLDPEQTVLIKVNQMARAGDLVRVLDLCRGAGLTQLNVVTLK